MVKRSRRKEGNAPLTPSQQQVFDFIRDFCRSQGTAPSYREIQRHLGYKAVGTVQDHVRQLLAKGWLEERGDGKEHGKERRRARSLFPAGFRAVGVTRIPIYGEIAAGGPRDAPQVELGTLVVASGGGRDPSFALRVVGDSMVDAGIFEGDHLLVERGAEIRNGDIVVALLNGETTVKRYSETAEGIFLVPDNGRMKAIPVKGERFEIQGRVVGLQRRL